MRKHTHRFEAGTSPGTLLEAGTSPGTRVALQLVALGLVAALAILTLGPVLDHHFAERHPGHHHLFLRAAPVEHDHSFAHDHANHALHRMMSSEPGTSGALDSDHLYFSPIDWIAASSVHLALPHSPSALTLHNDAGLIPLTASAGSTTVSGTTIAPPKRPPCA